jgi:DNA-binding IclR family transcriptional regulator
MEVIRDGEISMDDQGAQSINRVGRLLLAVAQAGSLGVRLSGLATMLELPHPTVHRMLKALCNTGVLQRTSQSNRYTLGRALTVACNGPVPIEALQRIARPALLRLATWVGDNVFLSFREGYESVCVDRIEGQFPIRYGLLDIGVRRPLGAGAASLALLADLPDDVIEDAIRVNRKQLTAAHTPEKLWALVEQTRIQGFAFDDGRLFAGGCGLGIAITDGHEPAVGAISIGAIAERMPQMRLPELVAAMRKEVQAIIEALAARNELAHG